MMTDARENFAGGKGGEHVRVARVGGCVQSTAPGVGAPRLQRNGSVLIIVLVTMLFAVAALTLFLEKASTDLIAEARVIKDARLRTEAYSALETTLAVLVDFRAVLGGLRSPSEGWDDPLGFAGYEPAPDREVTVTFEDESGKIPLPTVDAQTLVTLFKAWQMPQPDAEKLSDALLGWMKKEHMPTSVASPRPEDYERGDLAYQPPARSLRSFSELGAIEYAREVFFDEKGNPNDLYRRFVATFSLYRFQRPNLNAAAPDVLLAYGTDDPQVAQRLNEYRSGEGMYRANGAGVFKSSGDVSTVLGGRSTAAEKVGTEISALRVIVTVREGMNTYRLAALLAPPGGAQPPIAGDLNKKKEETQESNSAGNAAPARSTASSGGGTVQVKSLNYPFTLLEIRENGAIPTPDVTTASPL
jgi:general secretion pathway protein K